MDQREEDNKEERQKSLKELQKNVGQQVEAMKEEAQKSIKEIHENTIKQAKDLSTSIQVLKTEVETTKKSQRETTLEIENLGKKSGAIDANINNRIQNIEERISDAKDAIETSDSTVKKNAKCKKLVSQNIMRRQDIMRRPNLRIIGIEERKLSQLQERDTYEYTRSLQNSKQTGSEQKYLSPPQIH